MPDLTPNPEEASSMAEADLVIVGAGAKAAAIAGKVHAINRLGLASVSLTIIEKTEPAASWLGRNGMTSGEEPLAIPPIKDIGFPYRSARQFGAAGEEIDAELLPLSWQLHAMQRGEYAPWVNAGSPPVLHRDYGEYLTWVLKRATEGVRLLHGRVSRVALEPGGERWTVEVGERGEESDPERHVGRALLLTGPGVHHAFPHDPEVEPRIFHCDSRRDEFAVVPADRETEIAIVGGGESALSALVFLRKFRPRARITVYTPMLPLSRGESFLENRVFADPDDVAWASLDLQTRRDFVKHCDRGVFDASVLARIADDEHCSFVTGRVVHFAAAAGGERVSLEYESPAGVVGDEYDFVVNSTGFDLLTQLHGLFPEEVRAEIERRCGPLWDRPPEAELRFGRGLELEGMSPRLHIPGLAGLSQGPGFANLGSLGLLANRVLSPLLAELGAPFAGKSGNMLDEPLLID
jgi:mycobactin lysine-N-oxygenase